MKSLLCFILAVGVLCGCTKDEKSGLFTAKEAEASLTQADHAVIDRACAKVRAYDAAKKANAMTEMIEDSYNEAIEELKDLMGKIDEEGDSPEVNKRHAAVNWTLVAATFGRANGTCACQVMFAAQRGLIDAQRMKDNPPRGLTTYLLPPGDPRRIEDEYNDENGFLSAKELSNE